jgi:hypothetical protein
MNVENKVSTPHWLTIEQLHKLHNISKPAQAKYRKHRREYLQCLKHDPSGESCKDIPTGIPYYKQAGKIFYKASEIDAWIESGKVV